MSNRWRMRSLDGNRTRLHQRIDVVTHCAELVKGVVQRPVVLIYQEEDLLM